MARVYISKSKKRFNVKSPTFYFYMKTKILVDFQICISVPLRMTANYSDYSPFWLTSLIYTEKFEFENPAIMEGKQCKHMERFVAMAKRSDYFLSLDDKCRW